MAGPLPQAALVRVIASLIGAERAAIGGGRVWDAAGWDATTELGPGGLGLDSLELLAASDAVSRFFRLHEDGGADVLRDRPALGGWAEAVGAALARRCAGFTFATSGTTGLPKLCRQPLAAVQGEADFWAQEFGSAGGVVSLVAPHHLYGFLFTVLMPHLAGWPMRDARLLPAGGVCRQLGGGDLLVGHPVGLAALARSGERFGGRPRIVSATAALPGAVHDALIGMGAAEVVEVYGCSELGGIAVRRTRDRAFRLLPRWRRDGEHLTDRASGERHAVPDEVRWDGDGALWPAARRDGAVQVAGVTVHPRAVADRLGALPVLAGCRVSLDATLAEPRLTAAIRLAPGVAAPDAVAACERWARRNLTAPERPVRFDLMNGAP